MVAAALQNVRRFALPFLQVNCQQDLEIGPLFLPQMNAIKTIKQAAEGMQLTGVLTFVSAGGPVRRSNGSIDG